jgi:PTS system ascorbate-specific IIC component
VCGYAYGGWRGAFLGSFIVGIFLCAGPLVLYPAFANLGIAEASFPNVDYNIIGSIIYGIGHIFA